MLPPFLRAFLNSSFKDGKISRLGIIIVYVVEVVGGGSSGSGSDGSSRGGISGGSSRGGSGSGGSSRSSTQGPIKGPLMR